MLALSCPQSAHLRRFLSSLDCGASRQLKSGGALAFELGEGQAEAVSAMMEAAGFKNIRTETDFGGTQRAIIGTMLRI